MKAGIQRADSNRFRASTLTMTEITINFAGFLGGKLPSMTLPIKACINVSN
jgi:hypothetical protein